MRVELLEPAIGTRKDRWPASVVKSALGLIGIEAGHLSASDNSSTYRRRKRPSLVSAIGSGFIRPARGGR